MFNIVPSPPGHYFAEGAGEVEAGQSGLDDGDYSREMGIVGDIDGEPLEPGDIQEEQEEPLGA